MTVEWSPRARNHIQSIWIYLSERNPAAALRTIRALTAAGNSLAELPERGRRGREADTRELVVVGTPYILIYRVQDDRIEIGAVLHGAQRRPSR